MALLADTFHALFAHGTVQKSRLTEAAAADTPAEDLLHRAVVNDLDIRYDKVVGIVALVHVHHDALFDHRGSVIARRDALDRTVVMVAHVVQRGHIYALDLRSKAQEFFPAFAVLFALSVQLHHFEVDLFSVTEEKDVDKIGDRLGIAGARTARDDDVLEVMPVLAQ